ncbi:hypothetical protein Ae201684_007979 [Aphanomyces euteiches]|uniref:Uncharacterized protein n=1 Tax=Aphanomyces euteiches TaxID=100861 RepID=A0A6G0X6P7_9STRA|nr:hypothetical protein Ae201684_007979 [Aphanomyces euteiches]
MAGKDCGQIPQAHQALPATWIALDIGRLSQQAARTKNGNIKRLKQVCCIGSVVRRAIVKNQNGWTGTTIGKFPFSKLNEPVTSAFSTQQSSSTYVSSTLYTSAAEQWKARQDFTSILK